VAHPREEVDSTYRSIVALVSRGELTARIDETFPLSRYRDTLARAEHYEWPGRSSSALTDPRRHLQHCHVGTVVVSVIVLDRVDHANELKEPGERPRIIPSRFVDASESITHSVGMHV
jgi:hypothetical protein